MRFVYILLFYLSSYKYNGAIGEDNHEIEMRRQRLLGQLVHTRTNIYENYHLVTRQVVTSVEMYRNYRTVSVVFYPVLRDMEEARFTFQSEELHLNSIGSCKPQEVVINLKRGSYPAVNPDGYAFPEGFIDPSKREQIYTTEILSDGNFETLVIPYPKPGTWYALVYIKWEDPRTQQVSQEGLVATCDTVLYTDLQVKRKDDITPIDCYSSIVLDAASVPVYYKCITRDNTEVVNLNVTIVNNTISTAFLYRVQYLSLPSEDDYIVACAFDTNTSNTNVITFTPSPNSWHYIHIDKLDVERRYKFADCESYRTTDDSEYMTNVTLRDLMRDEKGRFFTYEYGIPTSDIKDATSLVNLTSGEIQIIRFIVNPFIDIGGTLTIEASVLMSLKYFMGYKRPIKKGGLLEFTEKNRYFKVVICLDLGHDSIPMASGDCKYNDQLHSALFVLNSTDSDSIYAKTIIPYPESGFWYLSMKLFCDDLVCPCNTTRNGTKYYVETYNSDETNVEDISTEFLNETRLGENKCNASVVLSITSSSCVDGTCKNEGNCLLNTFGGLVLSFCQCSAGYGGWDCSNASRMDSLNAMLYSILLLTLSNFMFFISIYIAVIRLYYTEAMMYTFTMVFSTFYHACDAPPQISFCITRGNILQFGDFYCGLMCFWVTLLAMSIIGDKLRSSLQLIGAIVIALITTWNMHSFMAFLLPVVFGVSILLLSWFLDYYHTRRMRYPKTFYIRHFPIGLVLVGTGLICYAFLQTEQNYKVVHSIWHMLIALCVVFLLPDVKRDGTNNPFLPRKGSFKLPFLSKSHTPVNQNVHQS